MVVAFLVLNRKVTMKTINGIIFSFIVLVLGTWVFNIIHPWLGIGIIFGLIYFHVNNFVKSFDEESK